MVVDAIKNSEFDTSPIGCYHQFRNYLLWHEYVPEYVSVLVSKELTGQSD
jgi:hypothetical protein